MEISEKLLIKSIANWCIITAEESTDNGDWILYHDEIASHFGVSEEWLYANHAAIAEEIRGHSDIVADLEDDNAENGESSDRCFDLDLRGNYCDVDMNEN